MAQGRFSTLAGIIEYLCDIAGMTRLEKVGDERINLEGHVALFLGEDNGNGSS